MNFFRGVQLQCHYKRTGCKKGVVKYYCDELKRDIRLCKNEKNEFHLVEFIIYIS